MKQIHHRSPAPAPQGLFEPREIVRPLRSQREGFEESEAPDGIEFVHRFEDVLRLAEPGVAPYTTVAAVRSRLTEV
jgi:hypothetical protein